MLEGFLLIMEMSDINIIKVSDAIDDLLDRPQWTRREYAFYQMLIAKAKQYSIKAGARTAKSRPNGPVKDLSSDINDIHDNIQSQPWFQVSSNQGTILSLFNNMKLLECIHQGGPEAHNYHYRLDLLLGQRNGLHLIMDVARDPRTAARPPYHFRVYYELGSSKGHIAAYTPGKSKGHHLPEYDHLTKLLPTLERHEIICLAIELVLYYDVDNVMSKLPLGNIYPVTLKQLMDGIINNISL